MKSFALTLAGLGALTVAGVLCRLAATERRDLDLLSVARLLEVLLGAELGRWALTLAVLEPARAAGRIPYEGVERAAFHATQALFLLWPFGVAALAGWLFVRGWALWAALSLWLGAVATLGACYPGLRGERLADGYRLFQVGAIAVALGAVAVAPLVRRAVRPGRAHLCSLFMVAGLGAELAGPYLAEPFGSWWIAQATWLPVLAAVAVAAAGRRPWGTSRAS